MKLPSQSVQDTLFVPLWGRAFTTENFPDFFKDEESVRIVKETGFNFQPLNESGEYYSLASATRAANFDREIREYLSRFPQATVISIGSGLDTTFRRIDNGSVQWVDLDLPEIIELRRKYIKAKDRERTIAQSCFDYSWMNEIDYDPKQGLFFIVGGVFYYFKEDMVAEFIRTVAERFPGSHMAFDTVGKIGLRISNRYVKKTGNNGAEMHFAFRNSQKFFSGVSPRIQVAADYPFYSRIQILSRWTRGTKFRMQFSDMFRMVRLVRLKFIP